MKKILILGGGFAGLIAAERLSAYTGENHQITLVSPRRTFTFYPALVRFAFGDLKEKDVTFDLAKKLHKMNVRFIKGEALHLKPEFHRVQITGKEFNGDLAYDYLVVAVGRRLATERIPGFFEYANHLLGINSAKRFGAAAKEFTKGNIVVALAPDASLPVPACETAFALAQRVPPDSPTRPVKISVVFPETVEEAFGGADIHQQLKESFDKHRIEIVENFPINEVSAKSVVANDDRMLPYDLLMLVPPFTGQGRLSENGITDSSNFVEVDEFMRIKKLKGGYAAGDIVSFPGPKLAHMAVGQADVAARNLISELEGREPELVYFHEIASIIDQGGADSIYLRYGIWDDSLYTMKKGTVWGIVKRVHDKLWRTHHKSAGTFPG